MSRSHRDQRGKRTNGEILGRGEFDITREGRMIARCGGADVGSPIRKRCAKRDAARLSRRVGKAVIAEATAR